MQKYSEFSPTGFDRKGAFLRDKSDWLVVPVSRNRDSGPLAESNFAIAIKALGGESDTCEIHRFGHWASGWFEIIICDPADTKIVAIAESLERALADYPVLDDQDFSRREWENYLESWDFWGRKDYRRGLRDALFAHYANGVSEDYSDDEIESALDYLDDDATDALRATAAEHVNWEYQTDDSGVSINISGLIEKTDLDALANILIAACEENFRARDITKLCRHLGASEKTIGLAIANNCTLVSQIQNLILTQN